MRPTEAQIYRVADWRYTHICICFIALLYGPETLLTAISWQRVSTQEYLDKTIEVCQLYSERTFARDDALR
jgi:hypothetical protein